jgi:hypothetical protein
MKEKIRNTRKGTKKKSNWTREHVRLAVFLVLDAIGLAIAAAIWLL